jgi:hypothetical protein
MLLGHDILFFTSILELKYQSKNEKKKALKEFLNNFEGSFFLFLLSTFLESFHCSSEH